ncbi:response regulator [Algoriphagus sp. AK58]|uniref:response regulator n=1 Tax=Algoriphagus sp. AK58 TaxID=1406877 RepID=UPI001650AF98|nr:response regulator [Algoriphagus sp. AK58]MBC6365810.1 response regulator [Algoriphagus sp. AK58]
MERIYHILLVEDNEGDIFLLLEAFEEGSVKTKISIARNGQEALDFLFRRGAFSEVERPDMVLLDINIPIFNGHEVLRQVKADPILKSIPVVVLTTSSNQKDIDLAYDNHCNSYVKKSMNMDDFMDGVKRIQGFWLELSTFSNR